MPTEVTDPEILKQLNAGRSGPPPAPAPMPPGAQPPIAPKTDTAGKGPSPMRSYFGQIGSDVWESTKHFGTAAARGALKSATAAGEDVAAQMPFGTAGALDPGLGDLSLQEVRRQAAEKVKGWTPPADPRFPYAEGIGEFVGESAVPSALSAIVPVPGAGKAVEKGLVKGGKWLLAGSEKKALEKATKGLPYAVPGKGGKFVPNKARQEAIEAVKEAQRSAEQKAGKVVGAGQQAVKEGERGALAGVLQPTEDRGKGAAVGGGTAVATEIARRFAGPKIGAMLNIGAATAATAALEKVLGHNLSLGMVEHLGFHDYAIWYAAYHAHLGEGVGTIAGLFARPAVVGGTAAELTGTKRKDER